MEGATLVRIASVAALHRIDASPRNVYVRHEDGVIIATFGGLHISGTVRAVDPTNIPPWAVKADQLAGMVSLFEGADVQIVNSASSITLKSTDRKVNLRRVSTDSPSADVEPGEAVIIVDRASLLEEVDIAKGFCSTISTQMPIITGVRLMSNVSKALVVSAFDGKSGLFLGSVNADDVTQPCDVTLPPDDLILALSTMRDDKVSISLVLNNNGKISRVVISDSAASVALAVHQGTWPNIRSFLTSRKGSVVAIDSGRVDLVQKAIKGLNSEETLVLETVDGELIARTVENEAGVFSITVGSNAPAGFSASFSTDATKLFLRIGEELEVNLPDSDRAPVMVKCGSRRVWVPLKVKLAVPEELPEPQEVTF